MRETPGRIVQAFHSQGDAVIACMLTDQRVAVGDLTNAVVEIVGRVSDSTGERVHSLVRNVLEGDLQRALERVGSLEAGRSTAPGAMRTVWPGVHLVRETTGPPSRPRPDADKTRPPEMWCLATACRLVLGVCVCLEGIASNVA